MNSSTETVCFILAMFAWPYAEYKNRLLQIIIVEHIGMIYWAVKGANIAKLLIKGKVEKN